MSAYIKMKDSCIFYKPFNPVRFEPVEIEFVETGINPFFTPLTLMKYEETMFDYT